MLSRIHACAMSLGLLLAGSGIAGGQSSQAVMPDRATAAIPSYEVMGFPITPHQISIVGSAHVEEQSSSPSLVMAGMPASPHQIAVLTPRSRLTAKAVTPTTVGRAAEQGARARAGGC
jgi:hypothetical protein